MRLRRLSMLRGNEMANSDRDASVAVAQGRAKMPRPSCVVGLGLALFFCGAGCGDPDPQPTSDSVSAKDTGSTGNEVAAVSKPRRRGPVRLGGGVATAAGDAKEGGVADGGLDSVMKNMKPLQILLGQWRGITRKEQSLVPHRWVWDLKTNPDQPALVLTSTDSPYFRDGRLTWSTKERVFEFTGTNQDGQKQVLRGTFAEAPRQVAGDADDQPQMTFKLELIEVSLDQSGDKRPVNWRVVFNQQENNRMLVELSRRRGSGAFRLQDTIGCQREGTSFAISDTDYGERTCVISQGLGTTPVSFQGKTYWVCCSGCKAAFEEEPEKWIARFEAMKQQK